MLNCFTTFRILTLITIRYKFRSKLKVEPQNIILEVSSMHTIITTTIKNMQIQLELLEILYTKHITSLRFITKKISGLEELTYITNNNRIISECVKRVNLERMKTIPIIKPEI